MKILTYMNLGRHHAKGRFHIANKDIHAIIKGIRDSIINYDSGVDIDEMIENLG